MAIQSAADNRRVWYTQWVEKELIPLLMNAYGYPAKYWRQAAKNAEQNLDALPIYEDFDSTVERIRLLLINKEILTRAEIKDFGWVRSKWPWCVGIFVRHAINHGPYPLASLGKEPNRNHVRNKAKKPEDEDIYIYCGRLAVNDNIRPEDSLKWKRKKKVRKPHWPQDDEQSEADNHDSMKPYWSQDDVKSDSIDKKRSPQMLPKAELTPLLKRLGLADAGGEPVDDFGVQKPLHMVHQLPPRPKFANHDRTGPPRGRRYGGPHACPQKGVMPMLDARSMDLYASNCNNFSMGALDQPYRYNVVSPQPSNQNNFHAPFKQHGAVNQPHRYTVTSSAISDQYNISAPSYQRGVFGQSYQDPGTFASFPCHTHGSFDNPYRYSAPRPLTSALVNHQYDMHLRVTTQVSQQGSSARPLRGEVDEFVPSAHGYRL